MQAEQNSDSTAGGTSVRIMNVENGARSIMSSPEHRPEPWWRSRFGLVALGFAALIAFYLLTEHTAHVFGVLPYVLLLACPLMHLFMHRGHGGHDHHPPDRGADRP